MNTRTLSSLSIAVFVLLGAVFMSLRYYRLDQVRTAREESRWMLTYEVNFEAVLAARETAELRLAVPFETPHCEVLNLEQQPWNAPRLSAELRHGDRTDTQFIVLTAKQAETYSAGAEFLLRLSPRADRRRQPALETLTAEQRSYFSVSDRKRGIPGPAEASGLRDMLELVPDEAETEAERVQWVFEQCMNIESTPEALDDVDSALTTGKGTPKARALAMVALCRAMRIPARPVAGFRIQQGINVEPYVWVEVYQNQLWTPYDPTAGWSLVLPMEYVPVWRGRDRIHHPVMNVDVTDLKYSITRLPPPRQLLQADVQHPLQILSLTRLPVPMHTVMKILLLLPFAALITAFVRNVVGVQTFGTFAPALLAVSFIYSEWKTGLLILIVVVAIGLFGRGFLERLRLLMVPRLSVVLTVVILGVVVCLSALHYMLPAIRGHEVLLPMVILTMLIERFHVSVEEDGLMYTVQLAVGTLVVAILCYLVLRWDEVGAWVLTYPEAHLFTIAAFILLGRYAGYRLTELWRFRDLVESSEAAR